MLNHARHHLRMQGENVCNTQTTDRHALMLGKIPQRLPATLKLDLERLPQVGGENRTYLGGPNLKGDKLTLLET